MGKLTDSPRQTVVSMRISEAERRMLEALIDDNSKNISGVMREALELYYSSQYKKTAQDGAENTGH
jgi:hypothetical protein